MSLANRTEPSGLRFAEIGAAIAGLLIGGGLLLVGLLDAARFTSEQWVLRIGLPFFWAVKTQILHAAAASPGDDPLLALLNRATPVLALLQWPLYLWLLVLCRRALWARVALLALVSCHLLVLALSA